jgi:hypothetical protein
MQKKKAGLLQNFNKTIAPPQVQGKRFLIKNIELTNFCYFPEP